VARRRFGRDKRMMLPIIVAISAIPQGYFVWLFGGDGEIDRHAIVLAVSLRIALWLMAGFALDRILDVKGNPQSNYPVSTSQTERSRVE
jgi:hypothetical protein